MRILQAAIYWFITGNLVFLIWADFEIETWGNAYFIWDAVRDLLFVLAAYDLIPKVSRWFVKPVIAYCLIRLIWEIINSVTGIGINHPQAVNILFLIITTGVALLLLKDLKDRWNQNS